MRRLRYQVAASLDGYIAGPNGEYDWIPEEPTFDFGALLAQFDTAIMGRGTYEPVADRFAGMLGGMEIVVVSTTLDPLQAPGVTVVSHDVERFVARKKREEGKDIWLFGGGVLFRSLLEAGLVDTVEIAVMPVLLGRGIRLLQEGDTGVRLRKVKAEEYPSAAVLLVYEVATDVQPRVAR